MPYVEPPIKRAVTFFDLQNLFLSSKSAWGYSFPNFDPVELSRLVITRHSGWKLTGIHLYTGIHDSKKSPFWHNFWTKKLASHQAQDTRVEICTMSPFYSAETRILPKLRKRYALQRMKNNAGLRQPLYCRTILILKEALTLRTGSAFQKTTTINALISAIIETDATPLRHKTIKPLNTE